MPLNTRSQVSIRRLRFESFACFFSPNFSSQQVRLVFTYILGRWKRTKTIFLQDKRRVFFFSNKEHNFCTWWNVLAIRTTYNLERSANMKASCRISFEVHLVGTCQSNARIGLQMCGNADKTLGGLGTRNHVFAKSPSMISQNARSSWCPFLGSNFFIYFISQQRPILAWFLGSHRLRKRWVC